MKTIIAGSRSFNDYRYFKAYIETIVPAWIGYDEIVSNATDALAIQYAKEKGIALKTFPAAWEKYGNSAARIRNKEMARYADALVAFWDGAAADEAYGTQNMIIEMKQRKNKEIIIIRVDKKVTVRYDEKSHPIVDNVEYINTKSGI